MDAKDAIKAAKQQFADLFASENVEQIGLEEVDFDDSNQVWKITLGFFRPSPYRFSPQSIDRIYKVLTISDLNGNLVSIKNREVAKV